MSSPREMISSPDIVESAARFLLAAGWRPDPRVSGSVRHDDRSKRVAVAVWQRMEFLLEPPEKIDPSQGDAGAPPGGLGN